MQKVDYLRRDFVLRYVEKQHELNQVFESEAAYTCFWEGVNDREGDLPPEEVQPVKHSSWEYTTYPITDWDGISRGARVGYVCKSCGNGEPEKKRYCGGCGARMDAKKLR